MLLGISNPESVTNLLSKQALRAEQLYLSNGQVCDLDKWRSDCPLYVLETSLTKPVSLYIRASNVFQTIRVAHQALRYALFREDEITFVPVIEEIADKVILLAEHHFDLAYCYLSWHLSDDYAVMHHLLTAITLARVASKSDRFSQQGIRPLVCAALSMNISMIGLQAQLQKQVDPLTVKQREAIRKHPEQGVAKLKLLGVDNEIWLDAVRLHHEKPDGSGYPKGVKLDNDGALLLSITDSFNAKMAQRDYKKNFSSEDATREMFEETDGFMVYLAGLLLQELGIYPAGSIVMLNGGLVACSILRGSTPNTPLALVFRHANGAPTPAFVVDTAEREFAVKRSISRSPLDHQRDLLTLLAESL